MRDVCDEIVSRYVKAVSATQKTVDNARPLRVAESIKTFEQAQQEFFSRYGMYKNKDPEGFAAGTTRVPYVIAALTAFFVGIFVSMVVFIPNYTGSGGEVKDVTHEIEEVVENIYKDQSRITD